MKVLVLNSGSSSQKSCLFNLSDVLPEDPPACEWEAKIEWQGEFAEAAIKGRDRQELKSRATFSSRSEALEHFLRTLWEGDKSAIASCSEIDVVGHRIVHGGPDFADPVFISPKVTDAIAGVSAFAPLHNEAELEGIEICKKLLGSVRQVAVFDTGFHKDIPVAASVYPGPYEWFENGIHRYGFHGINHQYCARRAAHILGRDSDSLRIVSCHLGNGCSLAAINNGKSVDTTMGFTPLEGLMMGTRSGSVDPGILTYLIREKKLTGEQLDEILNKRSGLLGVSGISEDMREILAARNAGNSRAQLAFDIYVHRLVSALGAMVAVLGGIDALVFTAGVGENSADVRAAACQNFGYLGLKIDAGRNSQASPDQDISGADCPVRILVIRAQEDWEIARQCWRMVRDADSAQPLNT
jgi:acetate kinase